MKIKITSFLAIGSVFLLMSFSEINTKNETIIAKFAETQPSTSISRGKAIYTQYCLPCHQVDGSGVYKLNPPLIKTAYVLGDKARLVKIILKGFNEGVEIDGDEYTNPMPAQSLLTDQQVADVASYVRNSFGNKAAMLTVAEVKAIKMKWK